MGSLVRWFFDNGGQLVQSMGIMLSLCFAALAFRADSRTRQADILIRITEGHREIWIYFEQNPELLRIFRTDLNLTAFPPTAKELRFVQFVINHIIITYRTQRMGIYKEPEALVDDIRSFFLLPIPRETWCRVRRFQDADFAAFFEDALIGR